MKQEYSEAWFDFKLSQLSKHIEAVERLLEVEATSVRADIEEVAQGIEDENEREEFYEARSDEVWEYEDHFPQLHRQTNHVAIMSFLEIELNSLCDRVARARGVPISVKDLARQGIERARTYLEKVGGVANPWNSEHWREVKRASEIRNAIVHNDGRLQNPDLIKYIKESEYLSYLENFGQLELRRTYAAFVFKHIRSVFELILADLKGASAKHDC